MHGNDNLGQSEKKTAFNTVLELTRKTAISCDKATRSIEEMTQELSDFYNEIGIGKVDSGALVELKRQLDPIVERYKTAVSKSMKCLESFYFNTKYKDIDSSIGLIGDCDPVIKIESPKEDRLKKVELPKPREEQINAILKAYNESGIAEEHYEGKIK